MRSIISLPIVVESIGLGLFFFLCITDFSRFLSLSFSSVGLVESVKSLVSLLDVILDEPSPESTLGKGEGKDSGEPESSFYNEEPQVPSAEYSGAEGLGNNSVKEEHHGGNPTDDSPGPEESGAGRVVVAEVLGVER